jgi:hypothetical protein
MRCQLAFQFLFLVLFDQIFDLGVVRDLLGKEPVGVTDA